MQCTSIIFISFLRLDASTFLPIQLHWLAASGLLYLGKFP